MSDAEQDVLLRICAAYGGDPSDVVWQSVEGVASIIEGLSGQVRAMGRDSAIVGLGLHSLPDSRVVQLGETIAKLVRDTTGWTSHIAGAIRSAVDTALATRPPTEAV